MKKKTKREDDDKNINYNTLIDNQEYFINIQENDSTLNILKDGTNIESVISDVIKYVEQNNINDISDDDISTYVILAYKILQENSDANYSDKQHSLLSVAQTFFSNEKLSQNTQLLHQINSIIYKSTIFYQKDREAYKKQYKIKYKDGTTYKNNYQKRSKKHYTQNMNGRRTKQLQQQKQTDDYKCAKLKLMEIWCNNNSIKYDSKTFTKQLCKTNRIPFQENANKLSTEQLEAFHKFSEPYLDIFKKYKNSIFNGAINKDSSIYDIYAQYPGIDKETLNQFVNVWLKRKNRNRNSKYDKNQTKINNNEINYNIHNNTINLNEEDTINISNNKVQNNTKDTKINVGNVLRDNIQIDNKNKDKDIFLKPFPINKSQKIKLIPCNFIEFGNNIQKDNNTNILLNNLYKNEVITISTLFSNNN